MGYLEVLSCGCVVFGKDAVVPDEDRGFPVIAKFDCGIHGMKGFRILGGSGRN